MTVGDLPRDMQRVVLENAIARLTMRLLRAGIDPEELLTQEAPSQEERAQLQATAIWLIGQLALDALDDATPGGNA